MEVVGSQVGSPEETSMHIRPSWMEVLDAIRLGEQTVFMKP